MEQVNFMKPLCVVKINQVSQEDINALGFSSQGGENGSWGPKIQT